MIVRLISFFLVVTTATVFFIGGVIANESGSAEWKHDLDRANTLLSQGKYNDAIALYDTVLRSPRSSDDSDFLERDKKNFLSYYKRALSYLGLHRYNAAISDLNSVLAIQPDFSAALVQRGKILAWQGDFMNAVKDLKKATKQDEFVHEVQEADRFVNEAQDAEKRGDYQHCIDSAGSAIGLATGSANLWQLRARCSLAIGDSEGAVGDLTQASKLVSTPEVNLKLSNLLFYSLNDATSALNAIKKCLHQDPENKACKKDFRMLKNASKSLTQLQNFIDGQQWHQAINILINEALLEQIKTSHNQLKKDHTLTSKSPGHLLAQLEEWTCQSFSALKKSDSALNHCNLALELNPESIPSLLAKSQILLTDESYDQAIQLLNKANEVTGGQNHQVRQQLEKAQRLLRQSKKRNYYKILGVPRDADSKTIRKAYRDLSKKYHPDKYRGDLDADAVSRKMAEINSAYEVLSNEGIPFSPKVLLTGELRTRYDNGDDPNDHEGQQGYPGGQPFVFQQGGQNFFFQHGGQHFQGGNFKFHFG